MTKAACIMKPGTWLLSPTGTVARVSSLRHGRLHLEYLNADGTTTPGHKWFEPEELQNCKTISARTARRRTKKK